MCYCPGRNPEAISNSLGLTKGFEKYGLFAKKVYGDIICMCIGLYQANLETMLRLRIKPKVFIEITSIFPKSAAKQYNLITIPTFCI
jgi:hypothetical protein